MLHRIGDGFFLEKMEQAKNEAQPPLQHLPLDVWVSHIFHCLCAQDIANALAAGRRREAFFKADKESAIWERLLKRQYGTKPRHGLNAEQEFRLLERENKRRLPDLSPLRFKALLDGQCTETRHYDYFSDLPWEKQIHAGDLVLGKDGVLYLLHSVEFKSYWCYNHEDFWDHEFRVSKFGQSGVFLKDYNFMADARPVSLSISTAPLIDVNAETALVLENGDEPADLAVAEHLVADIEELLDEGVALDARILWVGDLPLVIAFEKNLLE